MVQIIYATAVCLGYTWYFLPMWRALKKGQRQLGLDYGLPHDLHNQDITMCCSFTAQVGFPQLKHSQLWISK